MIFNIILFLFFGYCLIDVGRLDNLPGSDVIGAALWPQIILVLLLFSLAVNMINVAKKNKKEHGVYLNFEMSMVTSFFKSRIFIGIIIIAVMSVLLDFLGFVPTTLLLLFSYGVLLGEKKYLKLFVISLIATFLLFFIFSKGLSIILPRGIGPFREFAILLEMI
ncbi:tripartite tricarboxylate transporter TctB family protein [Anaerosphaera multitolerans]|nr:tripartite tricarboxylate transporter TctB family protein [Anaerosphaera multitolerans]